MPNRVVLIGNYGTDLKLKREINRFLVSEDPYGTLDFVEYGQGRGEVRDDVDLDMVVSMVDWLAERFQDALVTEELDPGLFHRRGQPQRQQTRIEQFARLLRSAIGKEAEGLGSLPPAASFTTSPPFMTNETLLERLQLLGRIAGHRDDVGELAGRDGAEAIVPADALRRDDRRRLDRLHRRHAVANHVGELPGVPPVRVDAAVGSVADLHARLHRLAKPVALRVGGLLVLSHHRVGPPPPPALLLDPVAVVDVGDEEGAVLGHQLDRLVVHQRPVLDGADPGADRVGDAVGPVRVRGDVPLVQRPPPRPPRGPPPRRTRAPRGSFPRS